MVSPPNLFALVGMQVELQTPQMKANGVPTCKKPSVPLIYCLCQWLEVRLLCTAVPAMFPVVVVMRLSAEDCDGSNGQWLDWPVFIKSPLLKATVFQLAVSHMVTFGMSKCTCCF